MGQFYSVVFQQPFGKYELLPIKGEQDICFIKTIFVMPKKSFPQNMEHFYSLAFQQPFGKYEFLPIKGKKEIYFIYF